MIDTKKPVHFYDDRGKDYSLVKVTHILYEDFHKCLCRVQINNVEEFDVILFDKETGEVLTTNYEFWYATNDIPVLINDEWIFDF